jgi:hypothetical protein
MDHPRCQDCFFWQRTGPGLGICRHTPAVAQIQTYAPPFQTVWASTDAEQDWCWQGVDRKTGKPFYSPSEIWPSYSKAVIGGRAGAIIGSHPIGGVRVKWNDTGEESGSYYIPWDRVKLIR